MIVKKIQLFVTKLRGEGLTARFINIFSVDVLSKVINIVLLPIYLNILSVEEFGLLGYLTSIISAFGFLHFGLFLAQSRLYHDYSGEERKSLLFTIFFSLVVFLSIFFIVCYLTGLDVFLIKFLFPNSSAPENYRSDIFLAILVSVLQLMAFNYLLTSERVKAVQISNLFKAFAVNLFCILLLLSLKGHVNLAIARFRVIYVGDFMVFFFCFSYYVRAMNFHFRFDLFAKILHFSVPVMLSALVGIGINFSDRFFITKYLDFKEMGIYNLAISVTSIFLMTTSALQNVWLPMFFKASDLREKIKKSFRIGKGIIVSYSVIIIASCFGIILAIWLDVINKEFSKAILLIVILGIANIITALTHLISNYFVLYHRASIGVIIGVFISGIALFLNFVFIRRFGIVGASFSYLIAVSLSFVIHWVVIRLFLKEKIN